MQFAVWRLLSVALIGATIGGAALLVPSAPAEAAFPGRNGLIVYQLWDGNDLELEVVTADGTRRRRLTDNAVGDFHPTWSPDGTKILFGRSRGSGRAIEVDMYVMDAAGDNVQRIFRDDTLNESDFAWSPDGTNIVFAGYRGTAAGSTDLFVIKSDGTALTRLTNRPAQDDNPSWSPDGSLIAFRSGRINAGGSIFTMRPVPEGVGNRPRPLTTGFYGEEGPNWSPDGSQIVFVGNGGANSRTNHLFVVNADGTNRRQLTSDNVPGASLDPAWSPNGNRIVFSGFRVGTGSSSEALRIFVIDAAPEGPANQARVLPGNPSFAYRYPDWQPLP